MTMRDIRNFEDRIDAHVDGALVPGEDAYPFIDPLLEADDEHAAFAATFVLLRHGTENALARIRAALPNAAGKRLTGIGRALQMGRADALLNDLGAVFRADDAGRTATAAEALSYHVRWKGRTIPFSTSCQRGPRPSSAPAGASSRTSASPRNRNVMRTRCATRTLSVREAALLAAAWTAVPGTLGIVRAAAATPSKDDLAAYRLLAALGEPATSRPFSDWSRRPSSAPTASRSRHRTGIRPSLRCCSTR